VEPRIPRVERVDILEAMRRYDQGCRPEHSGNATKHAVLSPTGRQYPPKAIISLASGASPREFSGGPESIRYLNNLGFNVIDLQTNAIVGRRVTEIRSAA